MWSLGIISYLLLVGCLPFNVNSSDDEISSCISQGNISFPVGLWKDVSDNAKLFTYELLRRDPLKRMTVKKAIEHDWIRSFNVFPSEKEENFMKTVKKRSIFSEFVI